MTDKNKIREEIFWRYDTLKLCNSSEAKSRREAYKELLDFIDSLPEEVSEDLEEAAEKQSNCYYLSEVLSNDDYEVLRDRLKNNFKAGANWKESKMIYNAVDVEVTDIREYKEENEVDFTLMLEKGVIPYDIGEEVKLIIVKEEEK